MKDKTLSYVLRGTKLSCAQKIFEQNGITGYLFENKTVKYANGCRGRYDFLILTKYERKIGIILKCDTVDVHTYVYKKERGKHYLSDFVRDGKLRNIWSDITTVACTNVEEYDKIKHIAEIAGYRLVE